MAMNPFFHTDFNISDSLKTVRKSVLIYETIISGIFPALPKGVCISAQVRQVHV